MKTTPSKATVTLASAAFGLFALTACGPTGAGGPVSRAATLPTATATPTAGPDRGSPAPVTLDEGADRTRITVAPGTTVRVDLHSTYWSPVTSSDPNLLAPAGSPSAAAAPSCRPGGGCGTVTTAFVARAAGSVRLTARRTSCGEAKPCPSDQQTFTVDVQVTR